MERAESKGSGYLVTFWAAFPGSWGAQLSGP
jgi:hypothetical protein